MFMNDILNNYYQNVSFNVNDFVALTHIEGESSTDTLISDLEKRALDNLFGSISFDTDESLYNQIIINSDKEFDEDEERLSVIINTNREKVFQASLEFLEVIDPPDNIKRLFLKAIEETKEEISMYPCFPPIDLPFAVFNEDDSEGMSHIIPIAVISLLYYLGIALYDDLIDNDFGDVWSDCGKQYIGLVAICMFSGLPAKILEHIYGNSTQDGKYEKLSHIILETLYSQAIGQFQDLNVNLDHPDLPHISEKVTALKVGTTGALTGRLTAEFLGFSDELSKHFISYCKNLYTSMQITSDIFDIWSKQISPDLTNGTVTLPIAYTYLSLSDDDKQSFKEKIEARTANIEQHDDLREIIESTQAFLYSLAKSEIYRQKSIMAMQTLEKMGVPTPFFKYFIKTAAICNS